MTTPMEPQDLRELAELLRAAAPHGDDDLDTENCEALADLFELAAGEDFRSLITAGPVCAAIDRLAGLVTVQLTAASPKEAPADAV